MALRRMAVYEELSAQVRRILEAGIQPTHLDTHKHTHLAPPVLDAVARLGEEFDIPWVRRPFDFPLNARRGAVPRAKRLTNVRSQGEGVSTQLSPPLRLSIEKAIEYIAADEFVEATPKSLRLRKRILGQTNRRKAERAGHKGETEPA